jgi:hypothetical protein
MTSCARVADGTSTQTLTNRAAIAWDGDEPLNHAHGGVGDTPEEAIASVRCSWFPQPTLWCSYRWQARPVVSDGDRARLENRLITVDLARIASAYRLLHNGGSAQH